QEHPAWPFRHAGRGRPRRALPLLAPGLLHHRSDDRDQRRLARLKMESRMLRHLNPARTCAKILFAPLISSLFQTLRKPWFRFRRGAKSLALRVFRVKDASERVARGFALGMIINFIPSFGLGVLISG